MNSILQNEYLFRLSSFIVVFVALIALEIWIPKRRLHYRRVDRWPSNLVLVTLNTFVIRILYPTTVLAFSIAWANRGWGFFNLMSLPYWISFGISILVLDLAIYGQHALFHFIRPLWRFHKVHHSDLDFDATTGIRFHPVEMALSMGIKFLVIAILGAPAGSVVIFEILLNVGSMFSHANIKIPKSLESVLRLLIVTPDMHRIHHSVVSDESNRNFGFCLSIWDRIFKTYRSDAFEKQENITIGVSGCHDVKYLRIHRLLAMPFKN